MQNVQKQIFGLSDSASLFTPPWEKSAYFQLLASLSNKPTPEIIYIGAARGDDPQRITEFYQLSQKVRSKPRVLKFFDMVTDDPSEYFSGADIIYIDGGSSKNLLAILAAWNAVEALKAAYERGVIIAGASAGISILFDWFITDSVKTKILPLQGLGMLNGTACVHHNVRPDRRIALNTFLHSGEANFPAFAIDDGVALHFVNGDLKTVYKLAKSANHKIITENNEAYFPPPAITLLQSTQAASETSIVWADEDLKSR